MPHDLQGREYAKIKDVKEGDTVETDGDFTCRKAGRKSKVILDPNTNQLFIPCSAGRHYLDGQEKEDYYIGLYLIRPKASIPN